MDFTWVQSLKAYQFINQRTRASLIRVVFQQALDDGFLDRSRVDIQLEDEEIFRIDNAFDHIDRVELIAFIHRKPHVHERVDAHKIIRDLLKSGRVVQNLHLDSDEAIERLAASMIGIVEPLAGRRATVVAPSSEVGGTEIEMDVLRGSESDADAGVGGGAEGAVPGGQAVGAPLLLL